MDILNLFNPHLFIGLGFAMHIEAAVEYLKLNWRLPGQLAPFVASLFSFFVQGAVVYFYHLPLDQALIGTIFATASACFWHEISTPSK